MTFYGKWPWLKFISRYAYVTSDSSQMFLRKKFFCFLISPSLCAVQLISLKCFKKTHSNYDLLDFAVLYNKLCLNQSKNKKGERPTQPKSMSATKLSLIIGNAERWQVNPARFYSCAMTRKLFDSIIFSCYYLTFCSHTWLRRIFFDTFAWFMSL